MVNTSIFRASILRRAILSQSTKINRHPQTHLKKKSQKKGTIDLSNRKSLVTTAKRKALAGVIHFMLSEINISLDSKLIQITNHPMKTSVVAKRLPGVYVNSEKWEKDI